MIVIVDYGMGNLRSVAKAVERCGGEVVVSGSLSSLKKAEKIILPGVGAFGKAMENLRKLKLIEPLKKKIEEGTPLLGICLGLQLLFEWSEEGNIEGLGVVPGKVKRFPAFPGLKIPHMGWNKVKIKNQNSKFKIFKDIPNGSYFYFVHSYYVKPEAEDIVYSTTYYGTDFTSSIICKNLFACQFHPEKSSNLGLKLIRNFLSLH
ncbi:imidazole glycerol phosphate synthase subunit HisH [Candidatus Calescamantes bacterium]|nr:imidazole glycerol phosphate synthase subunit HisH [Candidatus Calescamantes bacterium]